ncbi:hypothetical protein [Tissierella creatinophila]|uniref:Uncharacterized protein n=1 Tax=Tissierella creatinophila DSM 6911 TaxID=1123403 RepID=A0A1U7M6B0_TISCR|nr:hypothetical protein [Tissierella creatinophila]OLS02821.1 hypothetical protein TICRE_11710 [Tissierella creatinophila DSM 6911]
MDYLEDMIYVNKSVLEKSVKSFAKNWMIVLTAIVYTVINLILYRLLGIVFRGPLFILSGIASALVMSSIVSNYLYLLFNIVNYNRLTINDFKEGFTNYVRKIYGVFFVGYLGSLLLQMVVPVLGPLGNYLDIAIYIVMGIALNALPETIYLKSYDAWESILYALEFLKENWLNWVIPNAVFYISIYLISGNILLNVFDTHLAFNFAKSPLYILMYAISQIVFSFMMIYRGHLYKILSTSTRRKRMFMKKI